jgi:CDP-6-deoxy-D-xylo-4-hexulose-3-dehydrase
MTSIEGGMICTDNEFLYNKFRACRSHGMLREMDSVEYKDLHINLNPDLNKDFIFMDDAFNMRSTELNAVMALNQLPRLDANNVIRKENLDVFLDNLDSKKYYTDFVREGNSNYAFTLLLKKEDLVMRDKVETVLRENGVEFRRGMSGGGNQLRQPYLKKRFGDEYKNYPNCDFIHFFGWYIGNYPELEKSQILNLTKILNDITM